MISSSAKKNPHSVEVTRFEKPSGDVYGVVVATAVVKSKPVRVGHAFLQKDKPKLTIGVPKTITPEDLEETLAILGDFLQTVRAQQAAISKESS